MIPLIIFLSIVAVILIFLFLPLAFSLSFDGDIFSAKVKTAGIKVYEFKDEEQNKKNSTAVKDTEKNPDNKEKKNIFNKLKRKYGFTGAVKEIFNFAMQVLKKIKKRLKHVFLRKVCLNIVVAGEDATATAVEYGAICSAVYPVLSFLDSVTSVSFKKINVSAGFNSEKSDFGFSLEIGARIIFLIIIALDVFSEYNKFKTRNEL